MGPLRIVKRQPCSQHLPQLRLYKAAVPAAVVVAGVVVLEVDQLFLVPVEMLVVATLRAVVAVLEVVLVQAVEVVRVLAAAAQVMVIFRRRRQPQIQLQLPHRLPIRHQAQRRHQRRAQCHHRLRLLLRRAQRQLRAQRPDAPIQDGRVMVVHRQMEHLKSRPIMVRVIFILLPLRVAKLGQAHIPGIGIRLVSTMPSGPNKV